MPQIVSSESKPDEPRKSPGSSAGPSAAVGYIIAAMVTLGLTLFMGLTGFSLSFRAMGWLLFAFMLIAYEVNKARRYRVKEEAAAPVVAERPRPIPDGSVAACPSPDRFAGHWEDERFVVTDQELQAILADPSKFDNVISGIEQSGTSISVFEGNATWFFVLANSAGVAFRSSLDQVWSLQAMDQPKAPDYTRYGATCRILGVDGRRENIAFGDDLVAWKAWCQPEAHNPHLAWALLAWSLGTGKAAAPFLGFPLPYATAAEGLSKLSRDRKGLRWLLKLHGPTVVSRWIEAAAPEEALAISQAVRRVALRRANWAIFSGAAVVLLTVTVVLAMLRFGVGDLPRMWRLDRPVAIILGCVLGVVAAAPLVYGWCLRRLAKRL